jgi:hypothetical protein
MAIPQDPTVVRTPHACRVRHLVSGCSSGRAGAAGCEPIALRDRGDGRADQLHDGISASRRRGRTAPSAVTGPVALVTLVIVHRLASVLRSNALVKTLVDRRVRVLVADGRLRQGELRPCGVANDDVYAQLRRRGIFDLSGARCVPYETKGSLTVVPADDQPLVHASLQASVNQA